MINAMASSQSSQGGNGDYSLDKYLAKMIEMDSSDLFLRPLSAPAFRVNGKIIRTSLPAPTPEDVDGFCKQLLTPVAMRRFEHSPDIDVAYTIPGCGRFRVNIFMQQGMIALAARLIPLGAVKFENLNLPKSVLKMADSQSGLILLVGPTGCGKSTTLASMIHHINSTREDHIVTIEDPIEFVHEEDKCLIHQRQVGYDTESFPTALKHVVRQSPDVIMIGEMRDVDTMQTAISAALTGHLILTTLHTTNVVQSIDRMLNYFPPAARGQAQVDLAVTLVGIVSMRLLPKADGSGRIPAVEVLKATSTVRQMITEDRLVDIYDVIKRGKDEGMVTLNQSLVELAKAGKISEADALRHTPNPDEFSLNMQGMFTGIDSIDLRTDDQLWTKKENPGQPKT